MRWGGREEGNNGKEFTHLSYTYTKLPLNDKKITECLQPYTHTHIHTQTHRYTHTSKHISACIPWAYHTYTLVWPLSNFHIPSPHFQTNITLLIHIVLNKRNTHNGKQTNMCFGSFVNDLTKYKIIKISKIDCHIIIWKSN